MIHEWNNNVQQQQQEMMKNMISNKRGNSEFHSIIESKNFSILYALLFVLFIDLTIV